MGNPNVSQGTLNRLVTSAVFNSYPALNVTASYLDVQGIRLAFDGDGALQIKTMTGTVQSGEPFALVVASIYLLKTQPLAAAFKAQLETDTNIGHVALFGDTRVLPEYDLSNCSLLTCTDLEFNGTVVGYMVRIKGTYLLNSALWNQ